METKKFQKYLNMIFDMEMSLYTQNEVIKALKDKCQKFETEGNFISQKSDRLNHPVIITSKRLKILLELSLAVCLLCVDYIGS